MIQGTLTITWPKWERWISAAGAVRGESIHSPVSRVSGSVLPLICFPSGEVLPSFNALAGIDFESLLLDTNGRFGRPT
jgi:hypothetical protein